MDEFVLVMGAIVVVVAAALRWMWTTQEGDTSRDSVLTSLPAISALSRPTARAVPDGYLDHPAGDEAVMEAVQKEFEAGGWFRAKLAGVTHENSSGKNRQVILHVQDLGALLHLVPEPENTYDPNAFAVYTYGGDQLGYLPRDVAGDMAARYESKERYIGVLLRRYPIGETGNFGATIGLLHIYRDKARELGLLKDEEGAH
ncbi:MAG TPA: HIRAN domain-containing protein [Granulicella sp.]|jgi:hypothetical protein